MIPEATIPDEGDRHQEPDEELAPQLGDELEAGFGPVLLTAAGPWEPGDRSSYARRPVLAIRPGGVHRDQPYAVWWEVYADDQEEPAFSYYGGGYHDSLGAAFHDWCDRKRTVLDRREEVEG